MATILSGILRRINRDKTKPLNILTGLAHEGYSTTMAKTGHEFYFVTNKSWPQWNVQERDVPSNIHLLGGEDLKRQLNCDITFDLVLSQKCLDHYPVLNQVACQMNIPLIVLHHSLPWIPPVGNWSWETVKDIGNQRCDHNVFVSNFSAEAWGRDSDGDNISIIRHGMDTEYWQGWSGGDGKIMTAVWDFKRRDSVCGYSLFQEVTRDLPVNIWGDSPGVSVMAKNRDHLRDLYRQASVYFNSTLWSSCPFSLLEAMSVGCPIVTTATTMMPEFIRDGVNGFVSNDPGVLREKLSLLISDPVLGKQIGEAGRRTILELFNESQFINKWNAVFNTVME